MIQFPRLVEETEGKDSEPDHAGICPVMSQVDSQRSHSEYHDVIDSRRSMAEGASQCVVLPLPLDPLLPIRTSSWTSSRTKVGILHTVFQSIIPLEPLHWWIQAKISREAYAFRWNSLAALDIRSSNAPVNQLPESLFRRGERPENFEEGTCVVVCNAIRGKR